MAKKPPDKPKTRKKRKHLGYAGTKGKPEDKVVVLPGVKDVDADAIKASNASVGREVIEATPQFPTMIDLKRKVSEGLVAANYTVYDWARQQFERVARLMSVMDVIEGISFTEEEIKKLTPTQRLKLWRTFEQALMTRVELMQVITVKAHEFHLIERFLSGMEQETAMDGGTVSRDSPYSPEFRARVRARYEQHVLERLGKK